MSTIAITFNTQPLDGGQNNPGYIRFKVTIDGVEHVLNQRLFDGASVYGYFTYFEWNGNQSESDYNQASNYAFAFRRDHSNVGGEGGTITLENGLVLTLSNLTATVVGNVVTIKANKGVFSDFEYSGDYLVVTADINNAAQPVAKTFSYHKLGTGDCDVENYRAVSATGGTAPYRLYLGDSNEFTGWDGITPLDFPLSRVKNYQGGLYDSLGALIKTFSEIPTKKLATTDFEAQINYYVGLGYSDITIATVVQRTGTTPLTYSLDDGAWQSSNIFGGVAPGIHNVKIRDKFGCSVSKVVDVAEFSDPQPETREPYFKISEYNSLSFYRDDVHGVDVRKNYINTPSFKEAVGLPKTARFGFPISSNIGTKFNSSYPYHNVTLHKWDGTKRNIQFFLIQENLGVTERVDCKLFPATETFENIDGSTTTITDGIGVYFDGGNKYEPQTSTIIDPSPYTSGLPSWAKKGSFVVIQGLGIKEIIATNLYDSDRDVTYFKVDGTISEQSGIVEAKFDRHPYNVYRFDFSMVDVHSEGNYIKIEPGYAFDEIDRVNVHKSEPFFLITDTSKYLKFLWKAFRNLGEMIFLDNMSSEMWVKGYVRPFPSGSSEHEDGDNETRSIDQEEYLRMRVEVPIMTAKQWRKFGMVGAIGNRGEVFIEDMKLVRIKAMDHDELGQTNVSNISCDFAYSGEGPKEGQQDPVLDISTGEVGTGGTGKEPVISWQVDGFRLITEEGDFVKIDGNFVEVD